ncbi:sugar ABC transporter permease [Nonomuraea sp. NPDC001636]|uniref:carbohydrate ABC transporter permease n=1 Tax=Nonomuraea sp. NPDC001636 TaxID=3154391 RepID=UPI0033229B74
MLGGVGARPHGPVSVLGRVRARPQATAGVALTLPVAVFFVVFWLVPFLSAIYLSFTDYEMAGTPNWIGLANYERVFADPGFLNSAWITVVYTVCTVVPTIVLALLVAVPLSRPGRLNRWLRALVMIPAVMPLAATSMVWVIIYSDRGLANTLLGLAGIPPQSWLTSSGLAIWALVVMVIWKSMGLFVIILTAGLQALPGEVYEAAAIDGSGPVTTFTRITLPLLRRTLLFVLVISVAGSMQAFVPAFLLTGGGPADATQVLPYYIWANAFPYEHMGYAAAMGMVLLVAMVIVSALQFAFLKGGDE